MPIINGVEVEGCYFYYNGECRCELNCIDLKNGGVIQELFNRPEHNYMECEPSEDCYFKQLQRVKAENEKLTKQRDILLEQLVINDGEDVTVQISLSQFDEYNELQAENKTLKSQLDFEVQKKEVIETENEKLEQENKELTHYLACMTEQRNKANTTLQKIKEIVIEPCIDGESCETCNSNCTNKDILTLIKKVEER